MTLATPKAACAMLGCTPEQLTELTSAGSLRTLTIGNVVRFYADEIELLQEIVKDGLHVEGE